MKKKFNFFNFYLLSALGTVAVVFNSYAQSSTSDNGVVINGVKWATRNVDKPGTFAAKPEDAGMFYQWNRKIGWSTTDPMKNSNGGTTWDATVPTGTAWEKVNDPSPTGWRVPTYKEQQTLFDTDKVSNGWTTQNGITGRKFTEKATGNSIFLPAVGGRHGSDGTLGLVGLNGLYWSSTAGESDETYAVNLTFLSDYVYWYAGSRSYGFLVRAVAE